ncbi:LANO_0C06634g1_1 [Lachancea nothofagi CBS 11611]|uniref:LANO_0C06634g1_1 n=1 Tax=Lachancea nothofagi CBS 11611 TaxID=1266666 RepID=A0A1G4J8K6_9SACH|nr:LANO_0C06634g1_1 [Lachancea nothofagi CBS 11611]
MIASQILRSTASIQRTVAASVPKTANKVLLRASHGRIGQSWAVAETKRLVPTVAAYFTFIACVLGWPFAVRAAVAPKQLY